MRILVTGAAGFVGRHAVTTLRARGHEVIAASLEGFAVADATPRQLDIRDPQGVARLFEAERPDAILHLAAIAFVPAVTKDPRLGFETNALGSVNLLAAARDFTPHARFVHVSTAEVYGRAVNSSGPITEATPIAPASIYGASKAAAEHAAAAFALDGLDAVILRPFNHIGPGQEGVYVVASFARQIAELEQGGGGVLRHGNLDAIRDFSDVRDIVRAYAIALEAPRGALESGAPYNVCSGNGVRIGDLVRDMVALAKTPMRLELDPQRVRKVDVPVMVGDASRFRAATGYAPSIPFATTLADIVGAARAKP
jgi:GDP-4-dehydro-6-deoxy-D-mannose reductase